MSTEPLQRQSTRPSGATLLHRTFSRIVDAEKAFARLLEHGVEAARVSVLARGLAVDQRLVLDNEMNANSAARLAMPVSASALAHKLSLGKRYLVEGCWVTGPIVAGGSLEGGQAESRPQSAKPDPRDVCLLLVKAGIPADEAARIEAQIQGAGGVWLGVTPRADEVEALGRALGNG